MNYFATLLSSAAHSLCLPGESAGEIERYVRQHQGGSVTPERAPFRRKLDFWAFAIVTATAKGLPPLDGPPSKWGGRKFVETREVQMPNDLCEMLAVVAFATLGVDHEGIDDPKRIVELANGLAGAGTPDVLKRLNDPDLRITALAKTLEFAAEMRKALGSK